MQNLKNQKSLVAEVNKPFILDTETTGVNPHTATLLGISSCNTRGVGGWSSIMPKQINGGEGFVGHNAKYDAIMFARHGVDVGEIKGDTMIMQYLLNITKSRKLEDMVETELHRNKEDLLAVYNRCTGKKEYSDVHKKEIFVPNTRVNLPEDWFNAVPENELATYAVDDAVSTSELYSKLDKKLTGELRDWYEKVEIPLCNLLVQMELKGVKVDREMLTSLRDELQIENTNTYNLLKKWSGIEDLNLNPSSSLQEALYEKLQLPILGKSKKTGRPLADKETLQILSKLHAFPKYLLEWREKQKILSTYTDSMMALFDTNDRIHTNYKQCWTITRRFASENPNLQNIPSKTELGRRVRHCFVPEKNHKFLIADYSQIELRILAHLSQDKGMIEAFRNDDDLHAKTAMEMFNVKNIKDVTKEQRNLAKTINFSIVYGKTAWGFSKDWNVSQKEAQEIIDRWFKTKPGVQAYIRYIEREAKIKKGWLKTIAGLPVYVGDPNSKDRAKEASAMRCAVDFPIQGSSQDILKKAMVSIWHGSSKTLCPVLMVHDELVYEILEYRGEHSPSEVKWIIQNMENAWKLDVPIKVEYKIADRWEK